MGTFLSVLNKKVQKFKTVYKLSVGKAFGMWLATEYLGLDESEAFEAVSIDGGNDKDIDLFFVDDEAERIVIGQLKFNTTGKYKARKNELLGLLHTTDWLKSWKVLRPTTTPRFLTVIRSNTSMHSVGPTKRTYPTQLGSSTLDRREIFRLASAS
jgi:hypothetical protein